MKIECMGCVEAVRMEKMCEQCSNGTQGANKIDLNKQIDQLFGIGKDLNCVAKKLIYVCSPLRGDYEGNTKKAQEYCKYVIKQGCVPMAVHLLFPQFMDDTNHAERALAIEMGIDVLKRCNELWIFGNVCSEGMMGEVAKAIECNIPIRQISLEMVSKCD